MYLPNAFKEHEVEKLIAFMQAHSFATLVSIENNLPVASHIPLVVTVENPAQDTSQNTAQNTVIKLTGHLAKANHQWKLFGIGESLAIFTGPHTYISPSLYENRESVPTWNYIAVHAYGTIEVVTLQDSRGQMDKMITEMIETYESSYHAQWDSLSDRYRESMMNGIVGFEMLVTGLQGKYKLSQNKSHADQHRVTQALLQSPDQTAHAVGVAMNHNLVTNQEV